MRINQLATCVAVAGLFSLAGAAQAAVLVSDDFSGPDGPLTGTTPDVGGVWTAHQGDGTNPVDVVSNAAVVTHSSVSASDDDVNSGFAGGAINSGTVFYAFDFSVADPGVAFGSDKESFAGFLIDSASSSNSNNQARMDIVGPAGGGDFSVGIADGGSADAEWATDLLFDVVYRAVVRYDFADGVSTLWIDPTNAGDTSIVSDANIVTELQAFAFRQSISSQGETITVDNLIVATTFAEAVPEPASLALLGFGGLAMLVRKR